MRRKGIIGLVADGKERGCLGMCEGSELWPTCARYTDRLHIMEGRTDGVATGRRGRGWRRWGAGAQKNINTRLTVVDTLQWAVS